MTMLPDDFEERVEAELRRTDPRDAEIARLKAILSDARCYVDSCADDPDNPENLAVGVLRRLDAALDDIVG